MDTKHEIMEFINQNSNNGALLVTGGVWQNIFNSRHYFAVKQQQ